MSIDWTRTAIAHKLVVTSIVLAAAYLLKAYYSGAASEDLIWIIGPVARLVELFSDFNFVHEPGYGWVDVEHDVVIAPACAGVNFYIIAFCMSAFQLTHRVQPLARTLTQNNERWLAVLHYRYCCQCPADFVGDLFLRHRLALVMVEF